MNAQRRVLVVLALICLAIAGISAHRGEPVASIAFVIVALISLILLAE